MKLLTGVIAASTLLIAVSGSAHAGGGFFALEGSALALANDTSDELNPAGLRFRLGTQINEMIDVEGHLGFSFDDNNDVYDELGATYFGAYLKGYLPLGYNSALFALGGMTTVNLSQKVGGGEFSESRAGFSYGFGLETRLTENADLTADYMSYLRDDGLFAEVSAFNFGIKLYF